MLARLRIGPKLLLAPGVVLVLLVLLCCGSYTAMVRQNAALDSIVQRQAAQWRDAAEPSAAARAAHAQACQMLAERASRQAAEDVRLAALFMAGTIACALCAALAIALAVRRALLADIGAIGAAARGLAGGDLTVRLRGGGADEIAQAARALDAGIHGLNGQLRTVLDAARTIGAASRDITLGRSSLPPRAQLHAAADRATATLQTLAAALGDDAVRARAADALAAHADACADAGSASMHRLVATIAEVRQAAARLEHIGAALEDTLAGADDGAAAGTGARALCAAREARTLAHAAVGLLDGGYAGALDAGAALGRLAESAGDASGIAADLGRASAGRARDVAGAAQAIVRMDELAQQGARIVEEAALAARTLQQGALDLARAVAAFRLDEAVHGSGSGSNETAPPGTVLHRPGRAGHPYLRLASSRREGPR